MKQEDLQSKVHAIISFFYDDLFREIYLEEINKTVEESEILPIINDDLLQDIALIFSMSYFLNPIIKDYQNRPDYEKLIGYISSITGMPENQIVSHSMKALELFSGGELGAYKFYWSLFNEIGKNNIPIARNPFPAPMFALIATQLMEYGLNGLKALKET